MKVLLVGNYEFDGSTSMQIWANALYRDLGEMGVDVTLIAPKPVVGRFKPSSSGLGKWFGYVDRFLIFPWVLRAAAASADVVHLCDHGSAMYAAMIPKTPVVVTCNDMLAVMGARGEVSDCPASFMGKLLQRWICHGLRRANQVACISQATMNDARRILNSDHNLRVLLDALNYPYMPITEAEADRRLAGIANIEAPFILHVGSSQPRKNREGILRVFAMLSEKHNLQMVFAGQPLSPELLSLADDLNVRDRVVQVVRPKVEVIEALYCRALALLFPSRYEGFGWPPIEAQACGCPVVGSSIAPLVEVLRDTAELRSLDDEKGMAEAISRIADEPGHRDRMKERGFKNVRERFQTSRVISEYLALYEELACKL